jgi:hypothetical protein
MNENNKKIEATKESDMSLPKSTEVDITNDVINDSKVVDNTESKLLLPKSTEIDITNDNKVVDVVKKTEAVKESELSLPKSTEIDITNNKKVVDAKKAKKENGFIEEIFDCFKNKDKFATLIIIIVHVLATIILAATLQTRHPIILAIILCIPLLCIYDLFNQYDGPFYTFLMFNIPLWKFPLYGLIVHFIQSLSTLFLIKN